jgi:hypothetical protein
MRSCISSLNHIGIELLEGIMNWEGNLEAVGGRFEMERFRDIYTLTDGHSTWMFPDSYLLEIRSQLIKDC